LLLKKIEDFFKYAKKVRGLQEIKLPVLFFTYLFLKKAATMTIKTYSIISLIVIKTLFLAKFWK
jgi:hypothetical protein